MSFVVTSSDKPKDKSPTRRRRSSAASLTPTTPDHDAASKAFNVDAGQKHPTIQNKSERTASSADSASDEHSTSCSSSESEGSRRDTTTLVSDTVNEAVEAGSLSSEDEQRIKSHRLDEALTTAQKVATILKNLSSQPSPDPLQLEGVACQLCFTDESTFRTNFVLLKKLCLRSSDRLTEEAVIQVWLRYHERLQSKLLTVLEQCIVPLAMDRALRAGAIMWLDLVAAVAPSLSASTADKKCWAMVARALQQFVSSTNNYANEPGPVVARCLDFLRQLLDASSVPSRGTLELLVPQLQTFLLRDCHELLQIKTLACISGLVSIARPLGTLELVVGSIQATSSLLHSDNPVFREAAAVACADMLPHLQQSSPEFVSIIHGLLGLVKKKSAPSAISLTCKARIIGKLVYYSQEASLLDNQAKRRILAVLDNMASRSTPFHVLKWAAFNLPALALSASGWSDGACKCVLSLLQVCATSGDDETIITLCSGLHETCTKLLDADLAVCSRILTIIADLLLSCHTSTLERIVPCVSRTVAAMAAAVTPERAMALDDQRSVFPAAQDVLSALLHHLHVGPVSFIPHDDGDRVQSPLGFETSTENPTSFWRSQSAILEQLHCLLKHLGSLAGVPYFVELELKEAVMPALEVLLIDPALSADVADAACACFVRLLYLSQSGSQRVELCQWTSRELVRSRSSIVRRRFLTIARIVPLHFSRLFFIQFFAPSVCELCQDRCPLVRERLCDVVLMTKSLLRRPADIAFDAQLSVAVEKLCHQDGNMPTRLRTRLALVQREFEAISLAHSGQHDDDSLRRDSEKHIMDKSYAMPTWPAMEPRPPNKHRPRRPSRMSRSLDTLKPVSALRTLGKTDPKTGSRAGADAGRAVTHSLDFRRASSDPSSTSSLASCLSPMPSRRSSAISQAMSPKRRSSTRIPSAGSKPGSTHMDCKRRASRQGFAVPKSVSPPTARRASAPGPVIPSMEPVTRTPSARQVKGRQRSISIEGPRAELTAPRRGSFSPSPLRKPGKHLPSLSPTKQPSQSKARPPASASTANSSRDSGQSSLRSRSLPPRMFARMSKESDTT